MSSIERNTHGDTRETIEFFPAQYVWDDLLDRHLAGESDVTEMKRRYDELATGFTHSSMPGIAIEASTDQ